MFENVSIIIPFQTDHGPREAAFQWVKKFYQNEMPEAEICIGYISGNEMNKAKAVNQAAKMATRDIFVIADADIVYDPMVIIEGMKLLNEVPWVVPFTEIYDVPYSATKYLLKKSPKWPLSVGVNECKKANWLYPEFAGKLNIIPRKNFEAVGGFDERFVGWGGEDDAFAHAMNTICGYFINYNAKIFHLWHPASHYGSNPNGDANQRLLNRYISASGIYDKMKNLISERKQDVTRGKENVSSRYEQFTNSPNSKICFAILVHENRQLIRDLIDNIRLYCPNSTMVLYNGGDDPNLCDDLGVPVCPSSRKLERGFTTIYFLETMEWLEKMNMDYEYLINIDSDAIFFRKGYEEFIQSQMTDTDYMAIKLRIPEEDWYIGNELKKDIDRWRKLFNVNPFYGIFNVGQVFNRSLVRAFLRQGRLERYKKALLETSSFGTDEIFFVNLAKELGFKIKKYPNKTDDMLIRYRPYLTMDEIVLSLNENPNSWLCHPVIRDQNDLARKLIMHLESDYYSQKYRRNIYPWHKNSRQDYMTSLPITSTFGSVELIVRSDNTLTHYWEDRDDKKWRKSITFAQGVKGTPIWHETPSGKFEVVCQLASGGVGLWWRDNNQPEYPWYGPSLIISEDVDPIMIAQKEDESTILVCKYGDRYGYWIRD